MTDPFDTSVSPVTEPESIVLGSYVAWRRELDYDDTLFNVKYKFTGSPSGSPVVEVSGTKSGDYWIFELLSATTGAWTAGEYTWDLIVERISDSEKQFVYTGSIEFFDSTDDRRTHAEIMVAKINSILEGRAESDVESYTIKSRSISKMSIKELTDWREYYLAEIARTGGSVNTGGVNPDGKTLRVRFSWD